MEKCQCSESSKNMRVLCVGIDMNLITMKRINDIFTAKGYVCDIIEVKDSKMLLDEILKPLVLAFYDKIILFATSSMGKLEELHEKEAHVLSSLKSLISKNASLSHIQLLVVESVNCMYFRACFDDRVWDYENILDDGLFLRKKGEYMMIVGSRDKDDNH